MAASGTASGRGVLVTGTDTGVGKTFVAALLARALRDAGLRVVPLKPVESGCDPGRDGRPFPSDAAALRAAAAPGTPLSSVCLYPLREPLSPHLAAAREGIVVDPPRIRAAIAEGMARADVALVEGAGGAAVEIAPGWTFADLARETGLSALVVAENRLGVLNHLRLTVSFLAARGVPLLGVVLNDRSAGDFPARETNGEESARTAGAAWLGRVPFGAPALPAGIVAAFRARIL